MKRRSLPLLVAILAAGPSSCSSGPPAATAPPRAVRDGPDRLQLAPKAPQWQYVQLEVAHESDPLPPAPYPARITIDEQRTSAVSTPLPGRIDRVAVRLGDDVAPGAHLFAIRSGALAELVKQVETAAAQVSVKQRVLERTRSLVQLKAAPEKEQLAAEAELHEAQLTLTAARARRDSIAVAPEASNVFWVVAPRRGVIIELEATAGQEVAPEREKPLLRISELSDVLVIADVPESDAADIEVGSKAQVRAQGDTKDRFGTVEHVSRIVVPARRTVEVRVRVSNAEHGLRPNGFAEVTFRRARQVRRVRVPSEAVVTDGARSVVFVARDEGRLERVEVTPGRQHDGEVELLAGLAPGTRYVAHGALLLLNEMDLGR